MEEADKTYATLQNADTFYDEDSSTVRFSVVPVEKNVSSLGCEFQDCVSSFPELKPFMSHVNDHLQEITVKDEEFVCAWRRCPFSSPNVKEFLRHFHFHAFHTYIKLEGQKALRRSKVKPCSLDSSEVNILPDLSDDFQCQWDQCHESTPPFDEAIKYYWHVRDHAEEFRGVHHTIFCKWSQCLAKFKTVSKLKDHLKSHSQERAMACPTCGNLFANRVKFFDHCNRQLPPEDKSFECSYCSKTFGVERLLRDHIRAHINTRRCPLCGMTTTTESNLRNHMRYRHSDLKPFECPDCDYCAKSNTDLQSHVQAIHSTTRYHKCGVTKCNFACENLTQLKLHVQNHHQDSKIPMYKCHHCNNGRLFKKGQYLSRHLIQVHGLQWPQGHRRFRYKEDKDGNYQLQLERFDFLIDEDDGQGDQEDEDDPDQVYGKETD